MVSPLQTLDCHSYIIPSVAVLHMDVLFLWVISGYFIQEL